MAKNQLSLMSEMAKDLGSSVGDFVTTTAQQAIQGVMGHNANLVSAQGQAAAASFNSSQANMANEQNVASMAQQYAYNSAQAQMANQFTEDQWNKAAAWNEAMWDKQAAFNAEQAQIQRDWQERMANTQYQRAMTDMQKAGLNPILAYGGINGGIPGGGQASVSGASMSSAQGAMASGGLLGANSGSISGYQGQAEYMGGVLNLLANALGGMASAEQAFGQLGSFGEKVMSELTDSLEESSAAGRTYTNEEGETIVERNAIGRFAEKMETQMKIATTPGSSWSEKKTNYYRNLAAITKTKRTAQKKFR